MALSINKIDVLKDSRPVLTHSLKIFFASARIKRQVFCKFSIILAFRPSRAHFIKCEHNSPLTKPLWVPDDEFTVPLTALESEGNRRVLTRT